MRAAPVVLTFTGHTIRHDGIARKAGAHSCVPNDTAHLLAGPIVWGKKPHRDQRPAGLSALLQPVGRGPGSKGTRPQVLSTRTLGKSAGVRGNAQGLPSPSPLGHQTPPWSDSADGEEGTEKTEQGGEKGCRDRRTKKEDFPRTTARRLQDSFSSKDSIRSVL